MLYDPSVIAALMDATETIVPVNPFAWVQAAAADPRRVYLAFGGTGTVNYQLTTTPDVLFANGFEVGTDGLQELPFPLVGPLCQREWWVYSKGAVNPLMVYQAMILRPGVPVSERV